jgi:hypothetical protein
MSAIHIRKTEKGYSVNGTLVIRKKDKFSGLHMLDFQEEKALRDFIAKEQAGLKLASSIV